ncbi:MAG: UPF0175 family protein [Prosthecobacter sp.]|nr:UPF0175 family protein [Prosthecobacter sp.]
MILTLNIPEDLSAEITAKLGHPGRAALEALAAEAYAKDVLSVEQVRRLLELGSRGEAQVVLSQHGVWPGLTADDVLNDAETAAAFSTASM